MFAIGNGYPHTLFILLNTLDISNTADLVPIVSHPYSVYLQIQTRFALYGDDVLRIKPFVKRR